MKTIEALRKLQRETKAEVFLVGGFVRDLLRRKRSKDLDVVVRKLTIKKIQTFLEKYGSVKKVRLSDVGNGIKIVHLLFKAKGDSLEAQISLPKKNHKSYAYNTLKQDVLCRDFTINGIYLPILFKSSKSIIDFCGGREDLRNRRLVSVLDPDTCIKNSPIRIMRAVSLAARTGYSIDRKLIKAMALNAKLLHDVPIEGIRSEFDKIILSKLPSKQLKLLRRTGILKIFLPELAACYGAKQNIDYHKYDVFHHCIYACDNADRSLVLRMAALLHDVGKVPTARIIDNHVTFHSHELHSTKLAEAFLLRMKYPNKFIKEVLHLIKNHMYHYTSDLNCCVECKWCRPLVTYGEDEQLDKACPMCEAGVTTKAGWTDNTIRKFIKNIGMEKSDFKDIGSFPLFKLRMADRLGSGFKNTAVTPRQLDFENRLVSVFKDSTALKLKDLELSGGDIMKVFNINPSPLLGKILDHLLDKVMEKPEMNNKKLLLLEVTDYLYENIYSSK